MQSTSFSLYNRDLKQRAHLSPFLATFEFLGSFEILTLLKNYEAMVFESVKYI